MSRFDSFDDYPFGITPARPPPDRDHTNLFHRPLPASMGSPMQSDRRTSYHVPLSLTPHSQSMLPRSAGIQEKEYNFGISDGWSSTANRHTPGGSNPQSQVQQIPPSNHHHLPLNIAQNDAHVKTANATLYNPATDTERENYLLRQALQSPAITGTGTSAGFSSVVTANSNTSRSTLWWGDLEPWMDEEYAKQVCNLMGWNPVEIKVPAAAPDPVTGQQANNPGYCFLTFPSSSVASSVLAQVSNNGGGQPVAMPNSTKPFVLNWSSSAPTSPPSSSFPPPGVVVPTVQQPQYPKEYSIFVGDLAPETSNSDLVAVFRNPVLGLRNDREPKFIRPFLSCKSAKIMLDPVTGVSRGYGFVRFTDEADQQRALIEMHGLYCLSRPMRISPATAKYKQPPSVDLPHLQFAPNEQSNQLTVALPLPHVTQTKSVSAPIAGGAATGTSPPANGSTSVTSSGSGSSLSGSSSTPSLMSSGSISGTTLASNPSDDLLSLPPSLLQQVAQYASAIPSLKTGTNSSSSISTVFAQEGQESTNNQRYTLTEESWKHHVQARAILGNLIGPNGEQLTSTDPYNTTVFVGGLSPLISEETLRTFFAPFGDIHYVKVPVGKHCGFVQFVRKADAERAIEKMQGFPIGGSRIRLSWGRSQYKAAQAAAQAAQAAAVQAQLQSQTQVNPVSQMTPEQAIALLTKLGFAPSPEAQARARGEENAHNGFENTNNSIPSNEDKMQPFYMNAGGHNPQSYDMYPLNAFGTRPSSNGGMTEHRTQHNIPTFSPFSPDPSSYFAEARRDSDASLRNEFLPPLSKSYTPGFGPITMDGQAHHGCDKSSGHARSSSGSQRYNVFLDKPFESSRVPSRPEPISRPNSSQTMSQGRPSVESDPIHDLNGMLASLDLDQQSAWKASSNGAENGAMGKIKSSSPS